MQLSNSENENFTFSIFLKYFTTNIYTIHGFLFHKRARWKQVETITQTLRFTPENDPVSFGIL